MKIKSIRHESSMTVEIKGKWYKEAHVEEIELEEGDNPEKERQDLIDRVHNVVDTQILEIKNINGGK